METPASSFKWAAPLIKSWGRFALSVAKMTHSFVVGSCLRIGISQHYTILSPDRPAVHEELVLKYLQLFQYPPVFLFDLCLPQSGDDGFGPRIGAFIFDRNSRPVCHGVPSTGNNHLSSPIHPAVFQASMSSMARVNSTGLVLALPAII